VSALAAPLANRIGNVTEGGSVFDDYSDQWERTGTAYSRWAGDFGTRLTNSLVSGVGTQMVRRRVYGNGEIDYGQIAGDAFGNTLGNSLTEQLAREETQGVNTVASSNPPPLVEQDTGDHIVFGKLNTPTPYTSGLADTLADQVADAMNKDRTSPYVPLAAGMRDVSGSGNRLYLQGGDDPESNAAAYNNWMKENARIVNEAAARGESLAPTVGNADRLGLHNLSSVSEPSSSVASDRSATPGAIPTVEAANALRAYRLLSGEATLQEQISARFANTIPDPTSGKGPYLTPGEGSQRAQWNPNAKFGLEVSLMAPSLLAATGLGGGAYVASQFSLQVASQLTATSLATSMATSGAIGGGLYYGLNQDTATPLDIGLAAVTSGVAMGLLKPVLNYTFGLPNTFIPLSVGAGATWSFSHATDTSMTLLLKGADPHPSGSSWWTQPITPPVPGGAK